SDVVQRLLTMSTQVVAQHAAFDLCEVLRSFSSVARRVLPTSIEWRLDLPTEAVHATVDRTRFEQALLALVVNARDVMPAGGALRVVLSTVTHEDPGAAPQQLARIAVTDTGPGIPADVAPRLWDPFFTTKAGGAGLGLPVALAIAREHDG